MNMSMQHRLHDDVVHADPWTFVCVKCAEVMTIKLVVPSTIGMETRTYECTCGHRETLDVPRR